MMIDGSLSGPERKLWDEIVNNFGADAEEPDGLPRMPLEQRARVLLQRARGYFAGGQPGRHKKPLIGSAPSRQLAESQPWQAKRDIALAVAVMMVAGAVVGIGRWTRPEQESGPQPVAFSEASEEDQLAAKRLMLGSEILLRRTGTCAEELEAAADGAWGSEPSREELLAGAALARQVGALCFPDAEVGSSYVVQIENGTLIAINGETLPGERNSAEALCNPAGLASLDERYGALPYGSAEQLHIDALRTVVGGNC